MFKTSRLEAVYVAKYTGTLKAYLKGTFRTMLQQPVYLDTAGVNVEQDLIDALYRL